MLSGLSAADTYVGNRFLLKRNTPALYAAGLVFQLVLAGTVAAPHGLDKAGPIFCKIQKFFVGGGHVSLLCQVFLGLLIHSLV